jgi:hypothetical protein
MKNLTLAVLAASVFAIPAISYAQSDIDHAASRTNARQQIRELESVGYNPASVSPYYPGDIQAAESRLEEQKLQVETAHEPVIAAGGYGTQAASSLQAGAKSTLYTRPRGSLYFGH